MRKIILLLSLILLVSCGSKGGSKDIPEENTVTVKSTVAYTTDDSGCLTSASNYDDSSSYTDNTYGYYKNVGYIWYCASYGNETNVYVSLSFDNSEDAGCLKIYSEYISSGICY